MIAAIDTNILIDILEPDPIHGPTSQKLLKRAFREGAVVACEVVWAEVAAAYNDQIEAVASALTELNIGFLPMTQTAALKAAACWSAFRMLNPNPLHPI